MIILDEKIVAIWFIGGNKQDFLAAMREIVPEEKYELTYRFRYHVDDKVFDSSDQKNWYEGTISGTRMFVLMAMRVVVKQLSEASMGQLYELVNDKGFKVFIDEFQKLPFNYMRMPSKKEAEEAIEFVKKQNRD